MGQLPLSLRQRIQLLGVPIDVLTHTEAIRCLQEFLIDGHQHHVMTPNSEMLVASCTDAAFREVLKHSDLNLPDSSGLLFAARWTGQRLPERVTGVDTVTHLCAQLAPDHPVYLLGAAPGIAERAAAALQTVNPQLRIGGTFAGSPRAEAVADIIERINAAKPHVLFVAYGAPSQDQWIARYLSQMPSVRIAIGVGGTFDFLAGHIKRAPLLLRRLHLEWAWRFGQEPSRWKRIGRAAVVFPILVLRYGKEAPRN